MKNPDGCMKQIHDCLTRVVNNHPPLKAKWQGRLVWVPSERTYILYLYHYHHLILVYDMWKHQEKYAWYERPADKRGLDSARIWLDARKKSEDK